MSLEQNEGYIKYALEHSKRPLPVYFEIFKQLNTLRYKAFKLGLIGYDPIEDVGFGNISQRISDELFIITGTKTGIFKRLSLNHHYAIIQMPSIGKEKVEYWGTVKPSSEAQTHEGIYISVPECQGILHWHSRLIWENTLRLEIPYTPPGIEYGTYKMAHAVQGVTFGTKEGMFAMMGHKDGGCTYAKTLERAIELTEYYQEKAELLAA